MNVDPAEALAPLFAAARSGGWPERPGVTHVTAVWAPDAEAPLVTMRIGPSTPKSACDFHLLQWSRAMADVIVVTGQILRDEPGLRYELSGAHADALLALRGERTDEPPELHVITSGRGLDPAHPALQGWARPTIVAPAAAELPPGLQRRALGVDVAAYLGSLPGRVSIEAGPHTTAPLHDRGIVDWLLLSECRLAALPDALRAGEALSRATLRRRFDPVASVDVREHGVPWRFGLWAKRV